MAAFIEERKVALVDSALKPESLRAQLPPQWKSLADNPRFIRDLRSVLTNLGPEELARPAAIASEVKRLVLKNLSFRAKPPPLPNTPHVLGSKGPSASIAYDWKKGGPRFEGQWVQPLWGSGGIAAGLTAQTVRSEGSPASLPVMGSGTVGVYHQVGPRVAVFVGAGASVGNSPVETSYGQTPIAAPNRLRRAAVGTLGPVVTVEAQVTPRNWPVVGRVDATAFLPMASMSAFDFAGQQARGQRIDVDTGLQAQVGATISGAPISLNGSMSLTPFARVTVPITGGGEVSAYVGLELGRSRKGRIPPSQPTLEVSPPPPDANTPTPPVAAPRQPLSHNGSLRPGAARGSAADLGGPITLETT